MTLAEGFGVRLATDHELATIAEDWQPPVGYRADMLAHPTAGRCLRNYALLTDRADVAVILHLSEAERFWSRYYWLARFAREWQAVAGDDAGLEQQLFQLLESAERCAVEYDPLPEVEAAVERDSVAGPRG